MSTVYVRVGVQEKLFSSYGRVFSELYFLSLQTNKQSAESVADQNFPGPLKKKRTIQRNPNKKELRGWKRAVRCSISRVNLFKPPIDLR